MDSQAIVNTMEVLETKPISELISEAIIKVCYVSDTPNPNKTIINRETGKEIAATLPGAPVAGFFNKETNDFEEHNRKVTFQNGELNVEDVTKAYGFVSFDPPWYQDFMEEDGVKTYLMCRAYLWTRQYEEAALAFNKGQSMELDEKTMSGYYQGDVFVFTSVTLDKLCILGDNYQPCFSGAKIMTTYAKQYETLAEKLEKTIGRRYYVMDDQLVTKPDKITLEYALQLGWNLSDAVYVQLTNRGAAEKYSIEGIYTEGGVIFAILQDRESLEYLKCDITISDKDTVELAAEMNAVTQTWAPKLPDEPEAVEPLDGSPAVDPTQEIPLNVSSTYTEGGEPAEPANPEPTGEGDPAPTATFTEGGEPTADPASEGDPAPAEPTSTFTEGDPAPAIDPAPADPAPAEPTATFTEGDPAPADPAPADPIPDGDPAPATDFVALCEEKDGTIATLTARITELEGQLSSYVSAEEAAVKVQKEQLIASYSESLSEEETKEVREGIDTFSLDDIESKLAVTYARKSRTPGGAAPQLQVNINTAGDPTPDLPDYMQQAIQYDKARELNFVLQV